MQHFVTLTLKPDHQRNLELQISARLGDAVSNNSAVDDPSEDVHQDGFYLQTEKTSVLKTTLYLDKNVSKCIV